jgi:hypothetical protein
MASVYTDYRPRQRPPGSARRLLPDLPDAMKRNLEAAEAALKQPFKGITNDGTVVPRLFSIEKTGETTQPIRVAVEACLAALTPAQQEAARFPLESDAWRRWSNIHPFLMRHGASLDEMAPEQRERALEPLRQALSERGFETARNVMRLNESIREITGRDEEYGEWLYWLSVMGNPSVDEPWGWQIDGHHLIVNCFVLGDQLVLTPTFMGSEPVLAMEGKYAGTRVFADEEANGLALIRAFSDEQRDRAIVFDDVPGEVFTSAFRDNFEMKYEGIRHDELSGAQQGLLLRLIETYVGRIRPGHDRVKLDEVTRHLDQTHFVWMGGVEDKSVFYYRVHSPVILIEFDHQRGIAFDNELPSRNHIHTVIRTPNGNDYGKDLLRQHYEQHHFAASH